VTAIDWITHGACRDEDPELFFPIATTGAAHPQIGEAKAVCFRCAVRMQCLSYAMETGQHGIWGGTTSEERLDARQRSRRLGREQVISPIAAPAYPTWSAPGTSGEGRDIPAGPVLPVRQGSRV
jgi:WhiB family transcriptional regulator, redox-sensing transcriptional regulator